MTTAQAMRVWQGPALFSHGFRLLRPGGDRGTDLGPTKVNARQASRSR